MCHEHRSSGPKHSGRRAAASSHRRTQPAAPSRGRRSGRAGRTRLRAARLRRQSRDVARKHRRLEGAFEYRTASAGSLAGARDAILSVIAAADRAIHKEMPPEIPPLLTTLREAARRLLEQVDRLPDAFETELGPTAFGPDGAAPSNPPAQAYSPPERPPIPAMTPPPMGLGNGEAQRDCRDDNAVAYPHPLPGIDADSAIAALCVTPEIFENIIVLFYRNNKYIMGKLKRAYAEKDWGTVKKLAHGIKGSAANIRAMALSESAQALENASERAAGDPSAPEPSDAARERLAVDLAQVLDGIDAAVGIAASPAGKECRDADALDGDVQIDRSRLDGLLNDFIRLLDLAIPEEILQHQERIRPYLPPLLMAEIEAAVHLYDYDEAQERVRTIACDMSIPIRAASPGPIVFSR